MESSRVGCGEWCRVCGCLYCSTSGQYGGVDKTVVQVPGTGPTSTKDHTMKEAWGISLRNASGSIMIDGEMGLDECERYVMGYSMPRESGWMVQIIIGEFGGSICVWGRVVMRRKQVDVRVKNLNQKECEQKFKKCFEDACSKIEGVLQEQDNALLKKEWESGLKRKGKDNEDSEEEEGDRMLVSSMKGPGRGRGTVAYLDEEDE
ncbi:hypothetical protein BDQ17DRAFT_1333895 [Cyathus striatus]|nr:hypothetical protein BDQ17DRAFT_1333895 [Cyathus striatus]